MTQYFLALQTPTVELSVAGTDPAGKQAHISVGFKRYEIEEAQERMDKFSEISKPINDLTALEADGVEIDRSTWREASATVREGINEMLREEIVYFTKVQLLEPVPGKPSEFRKGPLIADSRTYKDEAVLGGKSCLDFLLDMHIASSLWRSALISSMLSAINNYKLGQETAVKN